MDKRICDVEGCGNAHRARGLCSGHWKQKYAPPRTYATVPCAACGTPTPKTSNRKRIVCSLDCRWYLQWPTSCPVWFPECELCTRRFASQEAGARWCTDACEADATRTSWPACRVFFRHCTVCAHLFATRYTVTTCSTACAQVKRREDRREGKHRRRARQREAFTAPVIRRVIYERDRWRCHICGKQVKRDAVVPHPFAPTLDHVIPLAQGGTHEPANVSTAHFLCNALKGDRGGGEQLALIG